MWPQCTGLLIKDLCNSKRKQEQVSTEMQKYAKTSRKDLPKDIAVLGDPRKRLLLVSYKIPEFSPFTLGGIQPTTSFFILSNVSNFVCMSSETLKPFLSGVQFSLVVSSNRLLDRNPVTGGYQGAASPFLFED